MTDVTTINVTVLLLGELDSNINNNSLIDKVLIFTL